MSHHEHLPLDPSDTVSEDDIKIADNFETLTACQTLLDNGADPTRLQGLINAKSQELMMLLGEKSIYVHSETVYTPAINHEGILFQRIGVSSGDACGTVKSIGIEELPVGLNQHRINQIVLTLHTRRIFTNNQFLRGYFDVHVLCPVDKMKIALIENRDSLSPSDDDKIAADIDTALYNEAVNFEKLVEIFQNPHTTTVGAGEQPLQDMQLEVYLAYLNKNANFKHITALAPRGIKINGNNTQEASNNSEPYLLDGKFAKFSVIKKTVANDAIEQKLIVCTKGDEDSLMGVYVEEILDIQLR